MKYFVFVSILLPFSLSCFSQKKMESGFIVLNNGEQVEGLIDIQSNVQNSKTCIFRNPARGTIESLTPEDIKAYKTSSKYYVSRDIKIDSVTQRVFLEYLVDGIVDLYYLRNITNEYYFIEKDGQVYQLENTTRQVMIEGSGFDHNDKIYQKNINQYKGALTYLFSDAQDINTKIIQTPFNYKSLINLTKDYHNKVCSDYECIDYTKSTVQGLFLELSAGMSYSQMHLKTSEHIETNITPALTAQLRFVPVKSNTRWGFLIGLSFSSNNFQGLYANDLLYYINYDTLDIAVKYTLLRIPVCIQYEAGSGKLQPLIMVGYNANIYLGAEFAVFGHYENRKYPWNSDLRKFQHGFTGGLGLKYNLSKSKYLFLKGMYEYRIPSANLQHVLDFVTNHSIMVNFGLSFLI